MVDDGVRTGPSSGEVWQTERGRERVALPQAKRREGGRRGGEPPDRVVSFIKKFFITLCERMCYSTEEDLPRPA